LASGMPLVSTKVGDVSDVLERFKCGMLVESFSAKALEGEIRKFISTSSEEKKLLGRNARKAAEELFGLESVAKSYLRFYTEVLSEVKN